MLNLDLTFNDLIKSSKRGEEGFQRISVAVLADFATQHLTKALKAVAVNYKICLEVWEAEYDSISVNVFNKNSELYSKPLNYSLRIETLEKCVQEYKSDYNSRHSPVAKW